MSYVTCCKLLEEYFCLISGYSYFQLFEEQSKVEMQGENKDFWESLNAFAMCDNKSSDNKSHLHTKRAGKMMMMHQEKRKYGVTSNKKPYTKSINFVRPIYLTL